MILTSCASLIVSRQIWICSLALARKQNASLDFPPLVVRRDPPTLLGTPGASQSNSILKRGIGIGSSTTHQSSSSAILLNSQSSSIRRNVTHKQTLKTPPCFGITYPPTRSLLTKSCISSRTVEPPIPIVI